MIQKDMKNFSVSLVIPVHNEEENVGLLTEKILNSFKILSLQNFEIIYVDDGSKDSTYQEIIKQKRDYPSIRVVKLRRNFGKAMAYSAGFSLAKKEVVITMDGDLQDDPSDIGLFLEKIKEGYDFVNGWKTKGKGTVGKTFLSKIFNKVVSITFGINLHDFNCPFKAYRREIIEEIHIYSGLYRFIPVLAYDAGFKIAEVKVNNFPRIHGKSKYGLRRVLSGFYDYLTALFLIKFNQRPMYFFGSLALACGLLGTMILVYFSILSIQGEKVGSRPMFLLGILLEIISLQFFSIGFIGEMFTKSSVKIDNLYIAEEKS